MYKISIKAARVNKGLTCGEASKKLGISKTVLYNYESGKSAVKALMLVKMLQLYGIEFNCVSLT